jgi:hypothetical protein
MITLTRLVGLLDLDLCHASREPLRRRRVHQKWNLLTPQHARTAGIGSCRKEPYLGNLGNLGNLSI